MSYLLILILFIWIVILNNKCSELKIEFTRKISKLSEKIEKIQNEKSQDIVIQDAKNQSIITEPFDFEQQKILPAIEQSEKSEDKEALVLHELKQINKQSEEKLLPEQNDNISFNFEKLFMENIFNKIGAIALIIGMGFFIKIISPFIVFTPVMQIATGFIVGLGLLFMSIKIHKDRLNNYAEVLMGTSFSILFLTTYCSCTIYSILPIWAAAMVGSLLVVATYFVAEKYKSFATILIGLFGGYLNPFLIKSDISMTFIFSYLIFINIIGIIYTSKNRDKNIVNCLNLFLTTVVITVFSISTNTKINIILPFLLWGIYIFNNFSNSEKDLKRTDIALTWINFTSLFWFINYIFKYDEPLISGLILTTIGIAYGFGAYLLKQRNNIISKTYIYNILLSIGFAICFIKIPSVRFSCWIIEVLAILYFARKNQFILNWSNLFLIAAILQSCFIHNEYARLGSMLLCLFISIVAKNKLDKNVFAKIDWLFFTIPLIAACFMTKGIIITSIFATLAFILKIAAEKFELKNVEKWSLAYLTASFVSIFLKNEILSINIATPEYIPIFNLRTLIFAIPIITSFAYSKIFYKKENEVKDILRLLYLSFSYLWVIFEIVNYINDKSSIYSSLIIIIIGFIYAINTKFFAKVKDSRMMFIASYIITGFSTIFLIFKGCNVVINFIPVFNLRFFTYVLGFGTYLYLSKGEKPITKNIFIYGAALLGLILVHSETSHYLQTININMDIVSSLSWLTYAGCIMLAGIFNNIKQFKIAGIWITIIAVTKIVLFDLTNIDAIYKLTEFLILGIVLMLVSYFYTKNRKD